jgi:hypothetical protein
MPGSSAGKLFVSRVTSSIEWTWAEAQMIASGSLRRCCCRKPTARSATFSFSSISSKLSRKSRVARVASDGAPTSTSIQVMMLMALFS